MLDARSHVVISDHGGNNSRRVRVFGVQASWELNAVGIFSCFALERDLRDAGLGGVLSKKWVVCPMGGVGSWGGVISSRPLTPDITEISAEGWASLLRGQVVRESLGTVGAARGQYAGVARSALLSAGASRQFVTIGTLDESGHAVEVVGTNQDVIDDLSGSLSDLGAMEWMVDESRVFHAGVRLGTDYTHKYRLVEGRHIIDFAGPPDDLYAKPAKRQIYISVSRADARRRGRIRRAGSSPVYVQGTSGGRHFANPEQISQSGRRDNGVQYDTNRSLTPPGSAPQSWTRRNRRMPTVQVPIAPFAPPVSVPFELTLRNADNCFGWLNPGDTGRILLGSVGFSGIFRVFVKSIDLEEGLLKLAGEAISDTDDGA